MLFVRLGGLAGGASVSEPPLVDSTDNGYIYMVPVRYRPNAASGSVAVGGVRIISALSQASCVRTCTITYE